MFSPVTAYQRDRLRQFVAPVIPLVMLGVSGMTLVSAFCYWIGLIPAADGVPAVLLASGLLSGALAVVTKHAADRGMVARSGHVGAAFIFVVSGGVCLAAYMNGHGVIYGLPYCVLAAVGGSFFWLRRRQFITGQVAAFVPPLILMLATPPARPDLSYAIQLMVVTLIASTAIYLLTTRTNKRIYALSAALELRATFDGLTGVLNRSAWIELADRRLAEQQHQGHPVSCLFIDMDRFKIVNDHLGHKAGDDILRHVADVLNRFGSPERLTGRLGGDEFVMLLPGATFSQAEAVVEQLLDALRSIPALGNETAASVGIATSSGDDSLGELLQRADREMMTVKERNREHYVSGHDIRPRI